MYELRDQYTGEKPIHPFSSPFNDRQQLNYMKRFLHKVGPRDSHTQQTPESDPGNSGKES